MDYKQHWNKAYERQDLNLLGWYEEKPLPSLDLIAKTSLNNNARILNVGAGTSTLIDSLVKRGYNNILAADISDLALQKLSCRIAEHATKVDWLVDDLTNPIILPYIQPVDLWHDRAVLHFFTDPKDQDTYFNLLRRLVKVHGYVILATFNLNGATMCSGLPVCRYNSDLLSEKLGKEFELISSFDYTYSQPSGDTREYVYTLFRRNGN